MMPNCPDYTVTLWLFLVPLGRCIASAYLPFSPQVICRIAHGSGAGVGSSSLYKQRPWEFVWARRSVESMVEESLAAHRDLQAVKQHVSQCFQDQRIDPGISFAVDTALWDLQGQIQGAPICSLLARNQARTPCHDSLPITELIYLDQGSDRIESVLRPMLARGTRRVKVKTGQSPRDDMDTLRTIRHIAGSNLHIIVDANKGYSLKEARTFCTQAKSVGVRVFEEPARFDSWDELADLRRDIGITIMLDESLATVDSLEHALRAQAVDVVNVKLVRVGGITPALSLIDRCRKNDLGVYLGCAEDLGAGMYAILHLGAYLGQRVVGIGGTGFHRLAGDYVGNPATIRQGEVRIPAVDGVGADVRMNHGAPQWQGTTEVPTVRETKDLLHPNCFHQLWHGYLGKFLHRLRYQVIRIPSLIERK